MEAPTPSYSPGIYKQVTSESPIKNYTFFNNLKVRLIIGIIFFTIEIGGFCRFVFGTDMASFTVIPFIVFPSILLLQIFCFLAPPYCFRVTNDKFNRTITFGQKSIFPCLCNCTNKIFKIDDISNFTSARVDAYRITYNIYVNYNNGNASDIVYSATRKGYHPSDDVAINDAVNQFNMILRGEI